MAIDTSLIQDTDWLACTDVNGITYKVSGAEFKGLVKEPVGLELTIDTVLQSAGNKIFTLVTYNNKGTVDWGDGTTDDLLSATNVAANEYALEHDYPAAGVYTLKVIGPPGLLVKGTSVVSLQTAGVAYPITSYGPPDADYVLPTAGFLNRFFRNMSQDNIDKFDYSAIESFKAAWYECYAITEFPFIDISSGTGFMQAWSSCTGINTPFPLLDFSNALNLRSAWDYAINMPSPFPSIDVSSCTDFTQTWRYCYALTSFPVLDFSSAKDMVSTWSKCSGLLSFPSINTPMVENFQQAWSGCTKLTSFPSLDYSSAENMYQAWYKCDQLSDFPPNAFDVTGTFKNNAFATTFSICALTVSSIENILTSLDTNGQSNNSLGINAGTNAGKSTWTTAANTAYDNLIAKGWTVSFNP